jgi:hypothetical protein
MTVIRRNLSAGCASGVLLLALSMQAANADCLDDYVARNNAKHSIAAAMNDPGFRECRRNPNPGDRQRKLQRAVKAGEVFSPALHHGDVPNPGPLPPTYGTNFYPMLRNSFSDVWLFDKRAGVSDIADAEGAQLSFSDDRVALNRSWNAHAMGAVVFQYLHDRFPKDGSFNFIGLSLVPYVQVDRITNSNPKAAVNNVDKIAYGGAAEIGFDIGLGASYFRVRGAGVEDRVAGTTKGSFVGEWIPVIDNVINSPREFAGIPISFMFGPELKVRHDEIIVNDVTGAKQYLTRGGAQIVLTYKAITGALPDSLKSVGFLTSLHGNTTVSWLTTSDGRSYSRFKSSIGYNIDTEGYVALNASYTKGRDEDTGRMLDIWQIGLTGKL